MPRKGNPQHNARKRAARERHEAAHKAGFMYRRKADVERLRRVATRNAESAAAFAALAGKLR